MCYLSTIFWLFSLYSFEILNGVSKSGEEWRGMKTDARSDDFLHFNRHFSVYLREFGICRLILKMNCSRNHVETSHYISFIKLTKHFSMKIRQKLILITLTYNKLISRHTLSFVNWSYIEREIAARKNIWNYLITIIMELYSNIVCWLLLYTCVPYFCKRFMVWGI